MAFLSCGGGGKRLQESGDETSGHGLLTSGCPVLPTIGGKFVEILPIRIYIYRYE